MLKKLRKTDHLKQDLSSTSFGEKEPVEAI